MMAIDAHVTEKVNADFKLQTLTVGLLPRRTRDSDCLPEPVEIHSPGFTTLVSGSRVCLGITPEGDVHQWAAHSEPRCSHAGFRVEWSLSVLADEEGHHLQLRDAAVSKELDNRTLEPTVPESRLVAIALMDSGEVFASSTWYAGTEGSIAESFPNWKPVTSLQSRVVVSIACGSSFCAAVIVGGGLMTWGESRYGALGHRTPPIAGSSGIVQTGLVQRSLNPFLVQGELAGLRVAVMACGDHHMIAATFDEEELAGGVFSWGCSADGRLGYEVENEAQPEPRQVPWITVGLGEQLQQRRGLQAAPRRKVTRQPQRIRQLGCGSRNSVVVVQGGLVCFGANDCGQLGTETLSAEPGLMPPSAYAPALPEADEDFQVTSEEATTRRISCGPLHTAAVSTAGHVYIWGLDILNAQSAALPVASVPGEAHIGSSCGRLQLLPGFGTRRPVVALTCGAHFVVLSTEVEIPTSWVAQPDSQDGYLLGVGILPKDLAVDWRPANLPRKSERETTRHLAMVKELQQGALRRLDREKREEKQRQVRDERRERTLKEHTEIWMRDLLPRWVPGSPRSRRMEQLWRKGLPPRVREVLWPMAIGNVLRITPELFQIHKERAEDARRSQLLSVPANMLVTLSSPSSGRGREQSTECIPLDLPRTFPTLAFFSEGGPLHQDCARILEAYTFFRPDIGYVQGMSFLAAMLLLYLPPYPAFVGLCNLLNSPSVLGLYRMELGAIQCRAAVFQRLCAAQLPRVARCIQTAGLKPEMFLLEWFMTIFAKCLNLDVASVIWDLFFLDGEVVLYCAAIALLRISEQALLSGPADLENVCHVLGEDIRQRVQDPDELLWHIQEVLRRAPQLPAEIREIENAEFASTRNTPPTRPSRSVLQSVSEGIFGRWATR